MKLNEQKIGFLGAGKMASAIIRGLLKSGIPKENIFAGEKYEPSAEIARKDFGIFVTADNADVVNRADILIIAVKPKDIAAALSTAGSLGKKLFISIAAGVTTASLEEMVGKEARVVRVMPNICATVLESATGICPGKNATKEDVDLAKAVFSTVGVAMEVPEDLLDAVTGLSGSGPAYIFPIIEAMADGGVYEGLDRKTAMILAAQTVIGAARMVIETGDHPAELKDMVCSPAGTTIVGIQTLEEYKIRAAFMNAVINGAEKSKEIGKKK
ncbi:pyrroline-5-carboxylate reductase [Methanolapillus millepedarum]|uniref:Pyrroline-5-carboxylate reductase n=1 Tax=Methanolapillus millepedarum TaxID=3028296 RepID=A0AA96VFT6_9EURY|nr:Pyrroline-5-carboxylate reductase [Methanosarcinaceae archaeon Ac7]